MAILTQLKQFFYKPSISIDSANLTQEELQQCAAALMVDVAAADDSFEPEEFDALLGKLKKVFALNDEATAELVSVADGVRANPERLAKLLERLNQSLSSEQKSQIAALLWEVANSDGVVSESEEARVTELLSSLGA